MKSFNFIYTIDGIECQITVNGTDPNEALEVVKDIIPSATNITLIP